MNNSDLADHVAGAHGVSKADARKIVDGVFAAIADSAASGNEVPLSGFGKFKVKETAAREGRNPATGETIQIAAAKKLGFHPRKSGQGSAERLGAPRPRSSGDGRGFRQA